MKLFLSSTTRDLADARLTFIKQFDEICQNKIELVTYEKYGRSSILSPEETCLDLVRKCQVLMLFLDRLYGTLCKENNISITHAEVKQALLLGLPIIPIVRDPTWYEFMVWRKNRDISIDFAHVEEPALFELLEEIFSTSNCHHYQDFTSIETMKEIAKHVLLIIKNEGLGALDHVALM